MGPGRYCQHIACNCNNAARAHGWSYYAEKDKFEPARRLATLRGNCFADCRTGLRYLAAHQQEALDRLLRAFYGGAGFRRLCSFRLDHRRDKGSTRHSALRYFWNECHYGLSMRRVALDNARNASCREQHGTFLDFLAHFRRSRIAGERFTLLCSSVCWCHVSSRLYTLSTWPILADMIQGGGSPGHHIYSQWL